MKNEVIIGDCAEVLKQLPDESIDCIVTDPPYGYSFMGLSWDKALPSEEALRECCRVLKAGAFGFFMCAPRQDVLSRMIIRLEDAGFNVGFSSIYWSFASGFPKAQNMSKAIDRRFGAEREVIGIKRNPYTNTGRKESPDYGVYGNQEDENGYRITEITKPATSEAQALDGAYLGFQPKPALECIITVMKPLDCKTYVDQALKNGKGVSWLGDCKIPYESDADIPKQVVDFGKKGIHHAENDGGRPWINERVENGLPVKVYNPDSEGRFPANLLVSDNVLDRGIITKSTGGTKQVNSSLYESKCFAEHMPFNYGDSGDFSRYFSLDAWWEKRISELPEEQQKTFPFLIVPKPAKSEKNKYIENKHPTVKPLKLMSYLITMGSREGDVILDPFAGSGTTLEACKLLNRVFIGIDKDPENEKYMRARGQLDKTTLESFQEAES